MKDYFNLEKIEVNKKDNYQIYLKNDIPEECPFCQNNNLILNAPVHHSRKDIYNDVLGYINSSGNRVYCKNCGKTVPPVDNSVSKVYSDHFIEELISDHMKSNKPISEIIQRFGISENKANALMISFFNKKWKNYNYIFPRILSVIPVDDYLLLFDLLNIELLDYLEVDQLDKTLTNSGVEEVVFLNNDDYLKLAPRIKGIRTSILSRFEDDEALEELLKDAIESKVSTNILEALERKDFNSDILNELPFSLKLAYKALENKGVEQLKKENFKTDLKNFKNYLEKEIITNRYELRNEMIENFLEKVEEIKNKLKNPKRKRLSKDRLIGSIIFLK